MKRKSGDISCENMWQQEIQIMCYTDGRNQAYDMEERAQTRAIQRKIRIQLVLQIETGETWGDSGIAAVLYISTTAMSSAKPEI